MRAVAYLRVSTESQVDTWSIPAQRHAFEEYCQQKGWQPVEIYSEEGVSARWDSVDKRPQLRRLLDNCKKQAIDVVVVHSLDRWSRNLRVTLETFKHLADHRVAFVSLTEQIDYSTPEGRLFIAMIGAFAQYFSDSLSKHSSKGMKERAMSGLQNGDVPFGYRRCAVDCPPEHKGKVHLVPEEAEAVKKLFQYYSSGSWSLSRLAEWLNDGGFRTRNKRMVMDGNGHQSGGPKLFTIYSVRWLLHNPFFVGKVRYRDTLFQGSHEPILDEWLFEQVQRKLKAARKSGQSLTRSPRVYLLKGLARCVYCGFPLWCETSKPGYGYYREPRNSHARRGCPATGKAISSRPIDQQVDLLVQSLVLDPNWRRNILTKVSSLSEHERVVKERERLHDRLRRLGKTFVDGLVDESDYQVQKKMLQDRVDALVIPEAEAAFDAGEKLENLAKVWEVASLDDKHALLLSMLDAVYLDLAETRSVVGILPKSPFYPLFQSLKDDPEPKVKVFDPQQYEERLHGEPLPANCGMVETGESRTPRPEVPIDGYATSLFGVLGFAFPSVRRPNLQKASRLSLWLPRIGVGAAASRTYGAHIPASGNGEEWT